MNERDEICMCLRYLHTERKVEYRVLLLPSSSACDNSKCALFTITQICFTQVTWTLKKKTSILCIV